MGPSHRDRGGRFDESQGLGCLGVLDAEVARVAGGEGARWAVDAWLPLTAVGSQVPVLIQGERP